MKFTHYVENNVSIVALEGNLLGEADSQPTLEFIQNQIGEGHKHFVLNLTLVEIREQYRPLCIAYNPLKIEKRWRRFSTCEYSRTTSSTSANH